ncbi:hypothetical protein ACI3KS_00045 [Microbacterium sp. ZW T5_45]|uniref:hypothetical protein n=1 Tax=Microbacterium sp. ZW T5_45 TaxID=3378080 RepID=UPI003853ED9A
MTVELSSDRASDRVAGVTVISSRALKRVALGLVRDAARVPLTEVSVDVSDDRGALRLSVVTPLALRAGHTTTIAQDGDSVRRGLIDGMRRLAGRTVSTVDLRYSGVQRIAERRVT